MFQMYGQELTVAKHSSTANMQASCSQRHAVFRVGNQIGEQGFSYHVISSKAEDTDSVPILSNRVDTAAASCSVHEVAQQTELKW